MKHIKKFNELFSSLGSLVGKGAGIIGSVMPKVSIIDKFYKEDRDLGKVILDHIDNMPKIYNRTGVYDETTINQANNNWYYFVDKIFKNSGEKYKIDIIKHLDYKTKNVPEYTVTISKAGIKPEQVEKRLSGREIRVRDTEGGRQNKRSYSNSNIQGESERLDIDQNLAQNIYLAAESVWKEVHKNIKDDARGK
jgi:hypothetical protein